MNSNSFRILSADEARALIATAEPIGYAHTTCSGRFMQGYALADGTHVDHYMSFGWCDKFILSSADYREKTNTFNDRWAR